MTETDIVIVFTKEPTEQEIELTNEYKARLEALDNKVTIGAPRPR